MTYSSIGHILLMCLYGEGHCFSLFLFPFVMSINIL